MPNRTSAERPSVRQATVKLQRALDAAQARASRLLRERDALVTQLAAIRDSAEQLLGALTRASAPEARKPRGRPTGHRLTAASKRKIAQAARKRWAAKRAARSSRAA